MNRITTLFYIVLSILLIVLSSCNSKNVSATIQEQSATALVDTVKNYLNGDMVSAVGNNIRCILHDSKNNYWFGSDSSGLFFYSIKAESSTNWRNAILHITEKNGLCSNQVRTIQEDKFGNIWVTSGNGICFYNGKDFIKIDDLNGSKKEIPSSNIWSFNDDDLWFEGRGNGEIYKLDASVNSKSGFENALTEYKLPNAASHSINNSSKANNGNYDVNCIYKDNKGNLYFGTQSMGVCRLDVDVNRNNNKMNSFTWYSDKGLAGPAIRSVFVDKAGNGWFGNNGEGLFRLDATQNKFNSDEHAIRNLTRENKLSNPNFNEHKVVSDLPGSMARVWSICEDNVGRLWVATIDAGVWRYDPYEGNGNTLVNYTTVNGLPSNAVNVIYKDQNGDLLFGTSGKGVYKFEGDKFILFK